MWSWLERRVSSGEKVFRVYDRIYIEVDREDFGTGELSRRRQGDLRESRILYYAPNVAEAGWYY